MSVQIASSKPVWMQTGTYAEYQYDVIGIVLTNNTLISFKDDALATFRWECTKISGELATLNVSLNVEGQDRPFFLSTSIDVNTVSRQVFLSNGTLIGSTQLWSSANPANGEKSVVWDSSMDKIIGSVELRSWSNTPHGAQKIFSITGQGTIQNKSVSISGLYDLDTGVLISRVPDYEATLYALGVDMPLINGGSSLSGANIDLGPKEFGPEIISLLPFAALAVVFVGVSLLVYRRLKRKKR